MRCWTNTEMTHVSGFKTVISRGMHIKHVNPLHSTHTCVECPHLFWTQNDATEQRRGPSPSDRLHAEPPTCLHLAAGELIWRGLTGRLMRASVVLPLT